MGGEVCPNCKKSILISLGKRRMRCKRCNYIKYKSSYGHQRGTILEEEKKEEKEKELPKVQFGKERNIDPGEGYQTLDYKDQKFLRDHKLKLQNKMRSIEKILKELRGKKYSGIKEIMLEGELWDIETGKLVREKERPKIEKELEPEKELERMLSVKPSEEEEKEVEDKSRDTEEEKKKESSFESYRRNGLRKN